MVGAILNSRCMKNSKFNVTKIIFKIPKLEYQMCCLKRATRFFAVFYCNQFLDIHLSPVIRKSTCKLSYLSSELMPMDSRVMNRGVEGAGGLKASESVTCLLLSEGFDEQAEILTNLPLILLFCHC